MGENQNFGNQGGFGGMNCDPSDPTCGGMNCDQAIPHVTTGKHFSLYYFFDGGGEICKTHRIY